MQHPEGTTTGRSRPMKFGVFLAPFHMRRQNPTYSLRSDLELFVRLDALGYDEGWIGEHHSAGSEIIGAPELLIAAAAEHTSHMKFGTGVSSLPYHHPFILADRMVMLDHLTRGRAMLGVGPGALPSDAKMMGIELTSLRDRMHESLEAIIHLFRSDERLTMKTDWFTLDEARLQLRPYTYPHMEVAVASTVSPTGARAAGTFGVGLLNMSATSPKALEALGSHWEVAEQYAAMNGTTVSRDKWRLVGPMHIAETREQARRDVEFGLAQWVEYFRKVSIIPLAGDADESADMVDSLVESGLAVIGTPDDAIAQIKRLQASSGGFGTYIFMAHDWAAPEPTLKSYELCARFVFPEFQGSTESLTDSREFVMANLKEFQSEGIAAQQLAVKRHEEAIARHDKGEIGS